MKILGAGLSKTGTTSLHRGLGTLGFKSLHYDDRRLNDIIDGTNCTPDFRRYDDVDAVLDIPAACFCEELLQAYPQSKCILTVRDEDQWWNSIESHFNDRGRISSLEQNPFKWRLRHFVFGSASAQEFLFRKRYREHNARVAQTVPAERLLVMDVTTGEGWEKLCPFLQLPIPEIRFPHQNRHEEGHVEYLHRAVAELSEIVPAASSFVLVDECALETSSIENRPVIPFLEHDGQYCGVPEDDVTAIRECERIRATGASHIVFAWPSFWWLDYYSGFHQYLRAEYRCVLDNDRLIAFDFREFSGRNQQTLNQ